MIQYDSLQHIQYKLILPHKSCPIALAVRPQQHLEDGRKKDTMETASSEKDESDSLLSTRLIWDPLSKKSMVIVIQFKSK